MSPQKNPPPCAPPVLAGMGDAGAGSLVVGDGDADGGGFKGDGDTGFCPRSRRASAGSATWPRSLAAGDGPGRGWTSPTATVTATTKSPNAASRYSERPPRPPQRQGDGLQLAKLFQLREPQGSPGFLLFLCRLLRPVLRTYARAVAFLDRPSWPQPGRTPLLGVGNRFSNYASPPPTPALTWLLGKLKHGRSSVAPLALR